MIGVAGSRFTAFRRKVLPTCIECLRSVDSLRGLQTPQYDVKHFSSRHLERPTESHNVTHERTGVIDLCSWLFCS